MSATGQANAVADQGSGVTIYATPNCPYCKAAKVLLTEKGIAFTEVDVENDQDAANAMVAHSNGERKVPQIFIGAIHIGGSDRLQTLEQAGGLGLAWKVATE